MAGQTDSRVENPVAVSDRTAERKTRGWSDEGNSGRIERFGIQQSLERILVELTSNDGSQGPWRELDKMESVAQKVFHAAARGLRLPPRQLLQGREPEFGFQRLDVDERLCHREVNQKGNHG